VVVVEVIVGVVMTVVVLLAMAAAMVAVPSITDYYCLPTTTDFRLLLTSYYC
jgi:hypothetical protein